MACAPSRFSAVEAEWVQPSKQEIPQDEAPALELAQISSGAMVAVADRGGDLMLSGSLGGSMVGTVEAVAPSVGDDRGVDSGLWAMLSHFAN